MHRQRDDNVATWPSYTPQPGLQSEVPSPLTAASGLPKPDARFVTTRVFCRNKQCHRAALLRGQAGSSEGPLCPTVTLPSVLRGGPLCGTFCHHALGCGYLHKTVPDPGMCGALAVCLAQSQPQLHVCT